MSMILMLEIQGPMTEELFELNAPKSNMSRKCFFGKGRHRLGAVMSALGSMNATGREIVRTADEVKRLSVLALDTLRQGTNDPMRVEADDELGTKMFAIIHLSSEKL